MPFIPRFRRLPPWLLAVVLFAVTLVAYIPTLHNGFVEYDDSGYITANPHVLTGLTLDNVRWALTTFDQGNWHPVTWISHQLDAELYGLNPAGHHATSILLHALNALLLFLLLQAATHSPWRSLMVAGFFALHPINVESVSWAAERKSLLCMLFSLLAVAAYGSFVRRRAPGLYLATIAAFAMALMSKPMAVTLPALLLLIDYWPLERFDPASPDRRQVALRLLREKLPLFAMSAVSASITIAAQHAGGAVSGLTRLPLANRFENAVVAAALYLRRLVWPTDLAYFYPHRGLNLPASHFVLAAFVLAVIVALVWRIRGHRPLVFGFAFFAVAILPVIGILQVGLQSMADRYAYLPFIGLFAALAWEIGDLARRLEVPRFARRIVAILVLGLCATAAVHTEAYWHDSVTLFTRAHDVTTPPNLFIETNLAAALLDQQQVAEALNHFRIAESVAPQVFIPHYNIGYLLARRGELPAAIVELQAALRCSTTDENRFRALNLLANLYLSTNQPEMALDAYRQLLALDPQNAEIKSRIATLEHGVKK